MVAFAELFAELGEREHREWPFNKNTYLLTLENKYSCPTSKTDYSRNMSTRGENNFTLDNHFVELSFLMKNLRTTIAKYESIHSF